MAMWFSIFFHCITNKYFDNGCRNYNVRFQILCHILLGFSSRRTLMRSTSTEATVCDSARLSCRLTGRCASSLPARLSVENALRGAALYGTWSPDRVRVPTGTGQFGGNGWKNNVSDTGVGQTPEQRGSDAGFVIASETSSVLDMLFSSRGVN